MMPGAPVPEDARVLALFDGAGPVETPTPGARVWLARDPDNNGRPVLIKRAGMSGGGRGRATHALALRHPNIVPTRRWLLETSNAGQPALYVVRDVVRGKNLRQTLGGQTAAARDANTVQRLFLPVVDALAWAHGQNFAHGGLSAENILVASEDATVMVSDWATADSKAPQHFLVYQGTPTTAGDVKALARLITEFLPAGGAFTSLAVRERIGGVLARCATLADLRETLAALDGLATAPLPRGAAESGQAGAPEKPGLPQGVLGRGAAPLDLGLGDDNPDPTVGDWMRRAANDGNVESAPDQSGANSENNGAPRLVCTLAEKTARVPQGGGGTATLLVRNEGTAPLTIRMIATQHPWLNVRPLELPLVLAPGAASTPVPFAISAARLTPGEYRSEVYLSANAAGKRAEDLRGGYFKHVAEIRVTVDSGSAFPPPGPGGGWPAAPPQPGSVKPPYPTSAPKIPGGGSGCLFALPAVFVALCCRCPAFSSNLR